MMIEGMLKEMCCQSISVAATVKQSLVLVVMRMFDLAMLDLNLGRDRSYPTPLPSRPCRYVLDRIRGHVSSGSRLRTSSRFSDTEHLTLLWQIFELGGIFGIPAERFA